MDRPGNGPDADGGPRLPSPGPIAPSERIDGIDILRGLALFGVLTINIVFEFRVSIFAQFLPPAGTESAIDRALESFLAAAIELKALALFSFLFGVGLAIQFDRLAGNPRRLVLLVRRLVVLLAIGAVHLFLIWNGDILVEYAVVGLLVLPFLFAPRWLVLMAAGAALLLFLTMPLLSVVPFPSDAWIRVHVAEAERVYGTGGLLDVLAFRVREVPAIFPLHLFIFPRTVALFLFGVLAWRTRILVQPAQHRRLLFGLAAGGLILGAGLTVAGQWRLGGVVLALGYAATVILWVSFAAGQRMLAWAAPVGRMAFTNYLIQSLVLGWIFYGYGLGLFGRLSVVTAFAIGLGVYAAQVAFGAWWLRRYRYGPVEWLWRSLMYGKLQPIAVAAA
jgi:uncharacterized protein